MKELLNFQKSSKASNELSVNIFINPKEYLIATLLFFIIFGISLSIKYIEFKQFSEFKTSYQKLFVENQYSKKDYFVLKLITKDNFQFYSISKERIINLRGFSIFANISIKKNFTFLDYLSSDFLYIRNISLASNELDKRYRYSKEIFDEVHKNRKISELYSALFLATPIGKELREDLSRLGINHLAVLSGFHVSFIIGAILLILLIIYKPIHKIFFPFRSFYRDSSIFAIIIISIYLMFLGTPSSFLRSVTMFIIAIFIFDRNLLKAKFEVLILAVVILIAFQPNLIFSVGFWFSVSGVFYILLYIKFFNFKKLDLILINIWVFVAMIPIVHYIFPNFYFQQLLSPIWTILFSIFYPISAILHIIGFGDVFDAMLENFLSLDLGENYSFLTPNWFIILYLIFSIGLAFYKKD